MLLLQRQRQRHLQRAICRRKQQRRVILRLRCIDIVVEGGVLLLLLLLIVVLLLRRRRSVMVVVEMEALVRVLACVGRVGGDGLHIGRGAGRLLARLGAADDGDLDEAPEGKVGSSWNR
jgi:hypothetical protein